MKKFSVEKLGIARERLSFWELGNHAPIHGPGLWLTTTTCGVPHLTPETLQMSGLLHPTQQRFAGVLASFERQARSIDVYKAFEKGYTAFCGLHDVPCLLTVFDPTLPRKSGYSTSKSISVWGECNQRQTVDHEQYVEGIKALKPDAFVSLHDPDVGDSGGKRVQKALKFTHDCMEKTLRAQNKEAVIGVISGGVDKDLREKETKVLASLPFDGFFIDGFHENGVTALDMDVQATKDLIRHSIIPNVPENKPRFFLGMCHPNVILALVKEGVDFFETSYVYHMADKGCGFTFSNTLDKELSQKSGDLFIDLNDAQYKNDFSPIAPDCSCYACRKHTRGYIHHLLATKELLAMVLIVIHNLHHYGEFFTAIRDAIQSQIN